MCGDVVNSNNYALTRESKQHYVLRIHLRARETRWFPINNYMIIFRTAEGCHANNQVAYTI